jgi:hypothetical protein
MVGHVPRVTCPHCGQRFVSSDSESGTFELQGRVGSKAIIKCGDCGNGMLVGVFSKAKPIPEQAWIEHQSYIWEQFDSPEAKRRSAEDLNEILSSNSRPETSEP